MRLVAISVIIGLGSGCAPTDTILDSSGLSGKGTYGWFGTEAYYIGGSKWCYMFNQSDFSQPIRPLFRSTWPRIYVETDQKTAVRNNIKFHVAYAQHPKSFPVIIVDSRKFKLVSKGEYALPPDKQTANNIIIAMKSGSKAIVKSMAEDGTRTEDHYKLRGFAAMLDEVNKACPL